MKRYYRRGERVKDNVDTVASITANLDHELCRDNPDNWHETADGSIWCIHGNVSTRP